jgi:hypothetical protein
MAPVAVARVGVGEDGQVDGAGNAPPVLRHLSQYQQAQVRPADPRDPSAEHVVDTGRHADAQDGQQGPWMPESARAHWS